MQKTSKITKQFTGFPGDCSEQQLRTLSQFRKHVSGNNKEQLNPEWDQYYLLRFLRARKFELSQTIKMWDKFIEWRADNGIDHVQETYRFPELNQIRKLYPHGYHKVDRKHRPIYIQRVGFLDAEKIFQITTEERLLKYNACAYETLFSKIFKACTEIRQRESGTNERVQQTCTILDLKDVKLSNAARSYNFVKIISEVAQNNYPQILGKYMTYLFSMFIINAPFLFTGIWAMVSKWVDVKTRQKIKILGSNFQKELFEVVDPINLPDFIAGGKCRCVGGCLESNIGPWNPSGKEFYPNLFKTQEKENIAVTNQIATHKELVKQQQKVEPQLANTVNEKQIVRHLKTPNLKISKNNTLATANTDRADKLPGFITLLHVGNCKPFSKALLLPNQNQNIQEHPSQVQPAL